MQRDRFTLCEYLIFINENKDEVDGGSYTSAGRENSSDYRSQQRFGISYCHGPCPEGCKGDHGLPEPGERGGGQAINTCLQQERNLKLWDLDLASLASVKTFAAESTGILQARLAN